MNRKALFLLLLFSAVFPFAASFFYLFVFAGTAFGKGCYAAVKVYTLVLPAAYWFAFEREPGRALFPDRKKAVRDCLAGLATGAFIFAFVFPLYFFVLKPHLAAFVPNLTAKSAEFGIDAPAKFVAFSLFLSFPHSLIEELYWRYFVYGRSRAFMGETAALAFASAAFASHHYVVLYNFFGTALAVSFGTAVLLAGFVWAMQYRFSGSLVAPWISHAAADVCVLAIGYLMIFTKS